jgi:hypothetical protein
MDASNVGIVVYWTHENRRMELCDETMKRIMALYKGTVILYNGITNRIQMEP